MNALDKLNAVQIEADNRISETDRQFCEAHQAAYMDAKASLNELEYMWTDIVSRQSKLLEPAAAVWNNVQKYTYLPHFSEQDIRNQLEKLNDLFISNLVRYFNSRYYERLVRRKQREYIKQNRPFAAMEEDPEIGAWLANFHLWDSENEEEIRLNDIQRHDLNLMLQKRYGLLQWEQGSGKTLAGIASGLYRMEKQNIHHTWVVSSAISIRNNWDVVLPNYGLSYVFVEQLADLQKIRRGDFVLITLNKLGTYRRQIKRWVRRYGQKLHLVFDESDEMTNPSSIRAKAVLDCFRRCRSKLLTTGTSTRNNISEFAPQLELMYNNSANMLSWSPRIYHYDRGDDFLSSKDNPYFGKPIPAYKEGYRGFT